MFLGIFWVPRQAFFLKQRFSFRFLLGAGHRDLYARLSGIPSAFYRGSFGVWPVLGQIVCKAFLPVHTSYGTPGDGFFFPWITHSGVSSRPFGVLTVLGGVWGELKKIPLERSLLFIRGPQQSVLKTGLYTEGRFKPRRGRAFSFRLRSILDRKRRRFWTQALLKFRSLKTLVPLPQASRAAPLERAIVDKPTSERWLAPGESSWLLKAARFRPGLSVEWRRCRAAFNFIWGLNYARQWRLTQFFLRLRGLGGFSFLRLLALSAGQAIKHAFSNFFGPAFPSSRLFYFWACWLNGLVISNPFIQLFVGDILQVIPLAFTSFLPWGGVSVRRFVYFLRSQFISNTLPLPVGDTPTFFEADELTFSSVIIFEPVLVSLLGAVPAGSAPYLTHRLYNWKYIT